MWRISRHQQLIFIAIATIADPTNAFLPAASAVSRSSLSYNKGEGDLSSSDFERLQRLRLEALEEELRRPPSPEFSAEQLVKEVMNGLLFPYDPLPDAGFRMMLRTATKKWRNVILHSVGANDDADLELAASALGDAMGRLPHKNQFAILVGEGEKYVLDFPAESLDYGDGTCWVECRLRDKATDKLLVITGWDLRKREDGAWLVDSIEWQDFRAEFRPGIGREEWMEKTN